MTTHRSARARLLARTLLLAVPFLYVSLSGPVPNAGAADSLPVVVRVEEDWELVASSPDAATTAPQVACAVFPTGESTSLCAVFELNHQTQPSFEAGGMQLQIWDGPNCSTPGSSLAPK